ncbi:hypothetical protein UAY_03350 [Enterococcus moraviensis ATCC BAA-383]|uniref:Uncharacterized protein n=1 Tax=Enterococcus moraviensis ATCC BAA-383 TaxID=1158609 RepID=R2T6Q2_9ENTE|nr:hypothetical protein [Enterococcus moraviensis]EOH95924.1 hypothetical protein UAY_03350 [Enterococcus moraviensis ATCC BAA-383]EOT66411.1 hypothetical protein I586_02682 [Enterococcus moraviensis ATCC BAA-383]
MINKLKNKWWLFTILSGICMYIDPYFGFFSIFMIVILFFDIVFFAVMKGHFNIFSKKITDSNKHIVIIKKVFNKEVLSFKLGKLFTTVFTVLSIVIIFIQNIEAKEILTPYYFSAIKNSFALQVICIILALTSIIFSFILFWFYVDSYKQKLNQLE